MRYECIDAEKAYFPIRVLARVMEVARRGYFAWRSRETNQRAVENAELLGMIREIHQSSRQTYGAPRISRGLRKLGKQVSRKRVARLVPLHGIRSQHRRRFRVTTHSNRRRSKAPNLRQRQFAVEQPNQAWVGDITYIRTKEGWRYLAVLLDRFSRRVVGWSMSDRIHDRLTLSALEMGAAAASTWPWADSPH